MKKITQLEFGAMTHRQTWNHISSLQSELEALEGRKGFVPDWSEAPKESKGVSIRFVDYDEEYWNDLVAEWNIQYIPRPLPPKVTREKSAQRLAKEYVSKMVGVGNRGDAYLILVEKLENGEKLKDLCTAAGIPTTTEEV